MVKRRKTAPKMMSSLERDLKEWCQRPDNDARRRRLTTKDIEEHLRNKSDIVSGARGAAACLGTLSIWPAQHGALAILRSDGSAWSELDRALQYRLHEVSVCWTLAEEAARYIAHAIAFEEWSKAGSLAERMIIGLGDSSAMPGWDVCHFGVFMLKLWSLHTGREIDLVRPNVAGLGFYERLFACWTDEEALRAAVSDMCDYHLEQSFDSHGFPAFTESPYELFPIDFLALEVIRRQMGLPTPRPDHPLLATRLANPPPRESRPRMGPDPLLERVIAKAKEAGLLPPEEV